MANVEKDFDTQDDGALRLLNSPGGTVTIFGLYGDLRRGAKDVADVLQSQGFKMRFLATEEEGRPTHEAPAVNYYGVWPHIGAKAMEAVSQTLDVPILDLRGPIHVTEDNALELSDGKVAPDSSVSRAA